MGTVPMRLLFIHTLTKCHEATVSLPWGMCPESQDPGPGRCATPPHSPSCTTMNCAMLPGLFRKFLDKTRLTPGADVILQERGVRVTMNVLHQQNLPLLGQVQASSPREPLLACGS